MFKKLKNTGKIIYKCVFGLNIFFLLIPFANAASECSILNLPQEQKGKIITILEENIGKATEYEDLSSQEGTEILDCFRITTCTKTEQKPAAGQPETKTSIKCVSEYQKICTPSTNTDGTVTVTCQRIQVLITKSGIDLLFTYIGIIYRWAAGIIGIISVFYMVFGGIQIATAGEDSQKIETAKEKITQSLAGLVLLFLSALILYTINPNFFTL